jgi:hypothetical protein
MSESRLKQGDVTSTLIKVTEAVAEMNATDVLVLLYRRLDAEGFHLKVIGSDEVTVETANWLLDKAKHFLISEDD